MVWDKTSPANADGIRLGASKIRETRSDLEAALTTEGVFPGANTSSPVYRWVPRRGTTGSRPANDATYPGTVYINTDTNSIQIDTGSAWVDVSNQTPAGVVQAFVAPTVPSGWLLCDGSAVNRVTYAALFAAIGVAHGTGDGATTFNLPDFRGRFLRGRDRSQGRDPDSGSRTAMAAGGNIGDAIGSVQAHEYYGHSHAVTDPGHIHAINQEISAGGTGGNAILNTPGPFQINTQSKVTGLTVNNSGGNETRPVNANVDFIIKT